jgi:hypothetical protein
MESSQILEWIEYTVESSIDRIPSIDDWMCISDAISGTFDEDSSSFEIDMQLLLEGISDAFESSIDRIPSIEDWRLISDAILEKVEDLEYKQRKTCA